MKIVFVALSYDTHDVTSFAARKVERDDPTKPKVERDDPTKPKHIIEPSKRILRDISCPLSWGSI
jgi:hypothetical protein